MNLGKVSPKIPPLLTDNELNEMHNAALKLIEEIGLDVDKKVLKYLPRCEYIVVRNSRVHIKPCIIEEYVQEHRKLLASNSDGELNGNGTIIKYCNGTNRFILDPKTNRIRPVTTQDLTLYTKLVDSLYSWGVRGGAPGVPQDIHPQLQAITAFWIGSKYSRCGGSTGGTSRSLAAEKYLYKMHRVMEKTFSLPIYVVTPLKLQGQSLDIALQFLNYEDVSFSVSSMPAIGLTAPLSFIGAFVLAIAEVLGAYTIIKLIAGEKKVTFSINAHPFDFKHGTLVFGSPEHNLCDLIMIQVNRYYGHKAVVTRSLRSMALRPGIQAMVEKASSAIIGALTGSRVFSGAGLLALDNVFSPEQIIVDCEIADYAARFVKGLTFEDLDMWLEIIKRGVERGFFLTQKETIRNFRKFYWFPRLFNYTRFTQDIYQSEEIIKKRINDIIEEKIAEHDFKLDEEKEKKLDELYEEACRVLV